MPRPSDREPEVCPADVWATASEIDGWLTREEANLLYRYARPPWCEIGTYKGRSATVLAGVGRGYCIDLCEDWYTPLIPRNVTLIRANCLEVEDLVPAPLGFLYLDGDHSYQATLAAFQLYAPKVQLGGHVALHDAFELHPGELDWPDVREALFTIMHTDEWKLVAAAHRVAVLRRVK